MKNASLLPNYEGTGTDRPLNKIYYDHKKVACNRAWLHSDVAASLAGGKTRYKELGSNIVKYLREQRERDSKINVETDLRKIVKKAIALGTHSRGGIEGPRN